MQPRVLLCPRCLGGPGSGGVRYGNNPETVRQGWRRRNKKADTSIEANPQALNVPLNHWSRYKYEFAKEHIEGVPHGQDAEEYRARKKQRRAAKRREYMREYQRRKAKADSPQRSQGTRRKSKDETTDERG